MDALNYDKKVPNFVVFPFFLEFICVNLELIIKIFWLQSAVNWVEINWVLDVGRGLSMWIGFVFERLILLFAFILIILKVEFLVHVV